jgi:hypothetical protein
MQPNVAESYSINTMHSVFIILFGKPLRKKRKKEKETVR